MIGTPAGGTGETSDDSPGRSGDDRARAIEILDRLVAFDTTSSRSNLELIDWVARLSRAARHRRDAEQRQRRQGQSVRDDRARPGSASAAA